MSEFDSKMRTFSPIQANGSIKLILSQDNDKSETKAVSISPIQSFRYPYTVITKNKFYWILFDCSYADDYFTAPIFREGVF